MQASKTKKTHYLKSLAWCQAFFLLFLFGCQGSQHRYQSAVTLSQEKLHPIVYHAKPFDLLAWEPPDLHPITSLRIYIEGDGLAWLNRYQPSADPTPTDPIALRLAVADTSPNVLYLARPCQYVPLSDPPCTSLSWTQHRFHPSVLASYQQVLEQIKQKWQVQSFELVGFSGGGVIAALLAAEREDVNFLVTVAAPLSVNTWISHHQVSPLTGSLDPVDFVEVLRKIPQCHFVGASDSVVPKKILEDYQKQLASEKSHVFVEKSSHESGWVMSWPRMLLQCTTNFL